MIYVALVVRFAVALVFLRAGATKLVRAEEFRQVVANYQLLPSRLSGPLARTVPVVELTAGGLMLLGVELRGASVGIALMLIVFCAAISVNLFRGRTISCGCSGTVASDISWRHVASNCVMAAGAVLVAIWPAEPISVLAGVRDPNESAAWTSRGVACLIVVASVAVAALLVAEARRVLLALRASDAGRKEGVA